MFHFEILWPTSQKNKKVHILIKVVSKEEVVNDFQNGPLGFSKFKELSRKANIGQEIIDAGNVTIFSPNNQDFDKAPINFEEVEFTTLRRWMLKHFVKGFMFRKDMEFGQTPVSIWNLLWKISWIIQ